LLASESGGATKSGVFTPRIIQGRRIGAEELALIQGLIAEQPQWSRRKLSIGFCDRVEWRSPAGQLKDMSARLLFAKLAEQGLITLPPRQRRGGRQRLRALAQPNLFEGLAPEPITAALAALCPLEVILAERPNRVRATQRTLCAIWPAIIIWAGAAVPGPTCATSFATGTDAIWPAYSLPLRPGNSKRAMPSSAGATDSERVVWDWSSTTPAF
jgi:hypothetical protein